jgi:hypothetical protein
MTLISKIPTNMSVKLLLFLVLLNVSVIAQSNLNGEYHFRRQELVSGFKFSKDGKFQFFYSYGAIDRNATGTYTVDGETVILHSDKEPGKDFKISTQNKHGKGYHLKFEHPTTYLTQHIVCIYYIGGIRYDENTNNDGGINLPIPVCDSIYVQHELFPDVPTLIKDSNNSNTNFVLQLNQSLEQVSFKGINLKIETKKELSCFPNSLLPMEDIKFIKQ